MKAGILNVLKPPGMTSHDVVDFVRRQVARGTRVGHAGTLDPGAAGVLAVCVGPTTRLTEYLMEGEKGYRAEAALGVETDSLDAEGTVVGERDASEVTEDAVREALGALVGRQMMTPPMYSAARVRGERLYDLARRGEAVEREARPVEVYAAELVAFRPGARATVLADIRCSKGTYVRVLCADLGARLGVGAHMSFLVRTAVGALKLDGSVSLEEIAEATRGGQLGRLSVPIAAALGHLPEVCLAYASAKAFCEGRAVPRDGLPAGLLRVHDEEGQLLGIGEAARGREGYLKPHKVLDG